MSSTVSLQKQWSSQRISPASTLARGATTTAPGSFPAKPAPCACASPHGAGGDISRTEEASGLAIQSDRTAQETRDGRLHRAVAHYCHKKRRRKREKTRVGRASLACTSDDPPRRAISASSRPRCRHRPGIPHLSAQQLHGTKESTKKACCGASWCCISRVEKRGPVLFPMQWSCR